MSNNGLVLISTIHLDYLLSNYGSFWQHWCLRQYLKDKGFAVARHVGVEVEFDYQKWLKARLLDYLRIYIYWPLTRFAGRKYWSKNLIDEYERTSRFIKEYEMLIGSLKEKSDVDKDTLLVMGSDQNLNEFANNWFACFPKDMKRVMYAGSTDWVEQGQNPAWLEIAKSEIPKFSAVSVREEAGVEICQSFTTGKVAHVVDPVMLIAPEVLKAQASKKSMFQRDTLLCYMVNVRKAEDLHLEKLEEIACTLGCNLKIIGLQGAAGFVLKRYTLIPSPTEFLGMIRDAKYIVTNSFHGAAFAIIYEKPFICVSQYCEAGHNQNTRQSELMKWTGLQKCMFKGDYDVSSIVKILSQKYNYETICNVMRACRVNSAIWLDTALGNACNRSD